MSDELYKSYKFEKFKGDVIVDQNHSLQYVKRQCVNTDEIEFTIHVTNKVLKSWQDFKNTLEVHEASCFKFVDIFNLFLAENFVILIKKGNERIEDHLRRLASAAKSNFKGKTGDAALKFGKATKSIAIRQCEIRGVADVERELCELKAKINDLEEENKGFHERCNELYQSLLETEELMKVSGEKLAEAYVDIENIKKENANLWMYVDKISEQEGFRNCGKNICEVKERQQRRKIRELKSYVEKSLWFAHTFGLQLSFVEFKDETGMSHTIEYQTGIGSKKSYNDLCDTEKEKVQQILFIMDKFCIGEAAYHELTMADGGAELPRSYLVKQCKTNLNSLCHITRIPGVNEGAQLDFEDELKSAIRNQVDPAAYQEQTSGKLRIKISGDGAQMTRCTSFVVMSFSLLESDDVMSSKGTHTVAVVKGGESYDLLKNSFAVLFGTINKIIKEGKVTVDGHDIPVEIFLGGDYKFLLLLLGMKGATSDYACIWCLIHKSYRFDMSKPQNYYCEEEMARTLADIKKCVCDQTKSCVHLPLLNVPLENVILDELHLMLRITDVLTRNLVQQAVDWDKDDNHDKRPCERTREHLDALISTINSCGVCFKVWEKKNADGNGSGTYDFTSLMGSDKKLLLKHLPEKLQGVIKPDITSDTVINIWKDFNNLYLMLNEQQPSNEYITDYFEKARKWITLFISIAGKSFGYANKNVTPYMHSMVYHVPTFMQMHRGIKKFTGQGVEKNNDDCRRIHLNKSNKWDATADVLRVMKRVEGLSKLQRTPRAYAKRKQDYWECELKEKRAQHKQLRMQASFNPPEPAIDVHSMSPAELRAGLKKFGIQTRIRNLTRLKEMFQDAYSQSQ